MEQFNLEFILKTLQQYKNLYNIINEIENILPDKHKENFNDQISEIEKIAYNMETLEHYLYYEKLRIITKDPIIKSYEIEDFHMIENVFNNDPDQLTINDINYLFKLLNKFIKE